jgi:hypothetical protein
VRTLTYGKAHTVSSAERADCCGYGSHHATGRIVEAFFAGPRLPSRQHHVIDRDAILARLMRID